ncbi:MAG: hypothetical protein ACREV2_18870 [Burkholderiales bacterium]
MRISEQRPKLRLDGLVLTYRLKVQLAQLGKSARTHVNEAATNLLLFFSFLNGQNEKLCPIRLDPKTAGESFAY